MMNFYVQNEDHNYPTFPFSTRQGAWDAAKDAARVARRIGGEIWIGGEGDDLLRHVARVALLWVEEGRLP
jgi:hypothetical protein